MALFPMITDLPTSYYVCEKSDGMRYLLYLTQGDENEELHYLIDRRNDFWALPPLRTHFPIPRDHAAFHTNTLIDGELVIDTSRDGTIQPKYLVFDCMVLDGNSLMNRTLDKRLAYFKERIFQPYEALLKEFPQEIPYMHFIVELKAMQFGYAMEMMFRQILPSLPHGNDGLIFTCRMTDYKPGTDPHILKWKPEHENSIDFRLSLGFPLVQPDEQDMAEGITKPYLDYDAVPICDLHVYNGDNTRADTWYGNMHIEEPEWENLKALQEPLEDRIVECFMDPEGRWRFMRWRDDKKEANHISTVESVIESIRDRVTKEDLIAAAKGIRDEWKRREKKEAEKKRAGSAGAGTVPMQVKRKADEQGNGRPSPGPPGKS
jgi:mRNA guanylyltransferase